MKKIALAVLVAGLSASTFAATKEDINKSIDSCKQLTVQYTHPSSPIKSKQFGLIETHGYDGNAIDQLYTVFDLPEQKRQAKDVVSSAFEDKDPVELVKTDFGCTVKVSLKDESALKPIVEQK
ncbi:hypothetical protein [Burkholderia cenocepacia]|uniref:hypothetical protein n=1 Tax=Burkholderia cenocepacia TaxID=95486 RepID=UPI000AFF6CF1|nr:hypothetical protein [Burkholderia cenocepacia]